MALNGKTLRLSGFGQCIFDSQAVNILLKKKEEEFVKSAYRGRVHIRNLLFFLY